MPFSGNVYTPPTGAENAAPGQVVQSAVWNAIFTDMAAALTQLATQNNTTPTWANILAPNGGFNIWQRGAGGNASFSVAASSTQYTADRWYITTGANQACTVSAQNGLTAAAPAAHAAKIQRNNGQAGVGTIIFGYPLTTDEVNRLRGQMVSFSGDLHAGANFSPTNDTVNVNLYIGTGTPQKAGAAGANFSGLTTPLALSINLLDGSTSVLTGTSAGAVATNATQGELQVSWTPTGAAGADDSLTLDQFCLVASSIVQSFVDLPFDECLRQCKRFYRKSFNYGTAPAQNAGLPGALTYVSQAAAAFSFYINFEPVEMFATAVFTSYNPSGATANWNNDNTAGVSVAAAFDTGAPNAKGVMLNGGSTSLGAAYSIHYTADAGL